MDKQFTDIAWSHYQYWMLEDRKVIKKINELIRDIERNGHEGIGKPEPLRHELQGLWSRRITDEHRLIYAINGETICIYACRSHY